MGITKDLIFETMDRIIDSRSGYAFPHPEEAYKHLLLRKTKRFINRMLSKLGFVLIKQSDFANLLENCPTQNDEAGRKFLRYVLEKGEEIDKLFPLLSDEYSRGILKWFIQYRVCSALLGTKANTLFPPRYTELERQKDLNSKIKSGKDEYLSLYEVDNFRIRTIKSLLYNTYFLRQYSYKTLVSPKNGDCVLDIGACFGETSVWFSDKVGEEGHVWAFEPDSVNREVLEENIAINKINNISVISKGAFSENRQMYMNSNGISSHISEHNCGNSIDLVAVDSFVESNGIRRVDYIKMDIEGGERKAIEGMRETIKRFSPSLALSVYHLYDDIVQIPKIVLEINPEYQVYLDHFCPDNTETVMFFR